jgi:hypothetical protein
MGQQEQSTSDFILSLDDNILAVSLMDADFNIVEAASNGSFNDRFAVPGKMQKGSSAWAAIMFGIAELVDDTFGRTRSLAVDHDFAKLMLVHVPAKGFVGLVLNRSANADYITLKVTDALDARRSIEKYA